MNKLFSTLKSSIMVKFQPIFTKLRFWSTPAFWSTKVFTKARQFFTKLLDIKPKHKKDYYSIGRWLVSKRLAFAIVVALGIVCIMYINSTLPTKTAVDGEVSLPTYKYNSLALKFYSGSVNILAKDGHLAYTGPVAEGKVSGEGVLFDANGNAVYKGSFADNLFNGNGQLFYPEGGLRYQGGFSDNLFDGTGAYFGLTGSMIYEGDYILGKRSGHGRLNNSAGSQIFDGIFRNDEIVYSELMSKTTSEVSGMYSGISRIFSAGNEYCVTMDEIDAVYSAKDGTNSLEGEWTVGRIYVLKNSVSIGNASYSSIEDLTRLIGAADYYGTAWVNLPEAVCVNLLVDRGCESLAKVDMSVTADLEEVFTVNSYDKNYTIYLYSFVHDGLTFTFYCPKAGSNEFLMYSIEVAK